MAKNTLPEDFKDDILAESMNGRRRYQMISNADGTVSFVDVTEYSQVGSNFGQAQINATNVAVNESADKHKIIDSKEDLLANTQAGMMAGALAVKEIRSELNEKLTVVEVDMTSAKLNTDVLASYPAGFYRKNCVIIGISVYDRVNNNYYSLFGDTTVTAMLGSKVIVKTSQSNYIGAGSKIRVVLYKIA